MEQSFDRRQKNAVSPAFVQLFSSGDVVLSRHAEDSAMQINLPDNLGITSKAVGAGLADAESDCSTSLKPMFA